MKKFFYMAVAAIAALSSCSQDEVYQNEVSEPQNGGFTATIANPSTTRTTLGTKDNEGKYPVLWEEGDEVSINGVTYKAQTGESSTTTLTTTDTEAEGPEYKAYYPASLATDFSIPAAQYNEDGQNHSLPMVASSTTKKLEFHNIGAVLAITVEMQEGVSEETTLDNVKSITISSDKAMSGALTENYTLKDDTDNSNTTTLYCDADLTDTPKTFYIAVPQNTYNDLTITVSDGVSNFIMKAVKEDIEISAGYLYPINFQYSETSSDCLCLTALKDDSSVEMRTGVSSTNTDFPKFLYLTEDSQGWQDFIPSYESVTGTKLTLDKGQSVYFKAKTTNKTLSEYTSSGTHTTKFAMTGSFEASGNIMTLLNGKAPATTLTSENNYAFSSLFSQCSALVSAKNLKLPASTLSEHCYGYMFQGCTNLKDAPVLPATTLASYCYDNMFYGCLSLKTAPALPATKLAASCYQSMFQSCRALTVAPTLPATKMEEYCYLRMFENCSELADAPALLATTLARSCCGYMFSGCAALETAPELKAKTLVSSCYSYMFQNCSHLKSVTMLATEGINDTSLWRWLQDAGTDVYPATPMVYVAAVKDDGTYNYGTIEANTPQTFTIQTIE